MDLASSEVLLRVNAPGTPWHEADLDAAARIRAAGVVLPKCEDPDAVGPVAARLGATPLFLMVETARGVATIDGEMVEALHAAEARRTLARARRAGPA